MRALRLRQEPTRTAAARAPRTDGPAQQHGSALSVNCEEREGLLVLSLAGNLDICTAPVFQEHVRRYDPAEVQLVIDLAGVQLLDSTGLDALVSLRNRARREGRRLGLVCPDHRLMRLFWFTGLRPAFALGDDLATVRSALADGAPCPSNPSASGPADHLARGDIMSMPTTDRPAAQPRPPPCGLLLISRAILQDAAADVALLEQQMSGADGDAAVIRHGVAAVAVLDRAGRMLQTQGEVMLDQLFDMNFSTKERVEPSQPTAPGRPHPLTLLGRP